ncbi:MAG: hypothetical protein ABI551_18915 [Polyangiaceae bacterium]
MPDEAKQERKRTGRIGAIVAAFVVLCALVRAATSAPVEQQKVASDQERHQAFWELANEEHQMRRDAVHDFPADAWSQDDAFHNSEFKKARDIANDKSIRLMDVLAAMDEGMHSAWPRPRGVYMNPSVPPCRPRPIH